MVLYYPDVSSAQAGMSLAGAAAVCAKVTQGVDYLNPDYQTFEREAAAEGALFFAYHFLTAGQAAAQAAWCRRWAGGIPMMVDCEPTTGSKPTLADLTGFVDEYRRLGGIAWLAYLPRWYWATAGRLGGLGAPSLAPLIQRRMSLVSSDYVAYSDDGPGWAPYGGMRPAVWQYTADADWNGRVVDRNAFQGTVVELRQLVTTGAISPAPTASPDEEDDPMMLENGAGAETIYTFTKGGRSWVAFGCDASRTRRPAPKLRVAVHSASRGFSQIVEVPMPLSGKAGVNFTAKDADMISVVRQAGDAGDDVPVGYNLG